MTLRGVAVGTGYFSQFHYDAWRRTDGVQMVGVCSLDAERAQAEAAPFAASAYTEVAAMLDAERPDFIDVITPPGTHAAIVQAAAERGVHVLCQKALAPSFEEAAAIVATAQAGGVRLMVHDNFRFQPWHRELKRRLDDGDIGALQSIGCRTRLGDGWRADAYLARQPYFRAMPRFLVFETGVHFLDVFRFLGGDIAAVFARLRRLNPDIAGEDAGILLCELESGATALWDADRYHEGLAQDPRYTFGAFVLEGERGSLRLDEDGAITLHRLGHTPQQVAYAHPRRGFAGDSVHATFAHFIEALVSGAPFETDGADYLKTLAAQEAAYRSSASGRLEPVSSHLPCMQGPIA